MTINGFINDIKTWGFFRAIFYQIMSRLKPGVMFVAIKLRKTSATEELPNIKQGFAIRVATKEELEIAAKQSHTDLKEESIEKACARGDICVAVFKDKQIIAYAWHALSTAPHKSRIWIGFNSNIVYGYKAYTMPKYRQQGLFYYITPHVNYVMKKRGHDNVLIYVESHNYPSLISSKKTGHTLVGYAGYITYFKFFWSWSSLGAKKYGFHFYWK